MHDITYPVIAPSAAVRLVGGAPPVPSVFPNTPAGQAAQAAAKEAAAAALIPEAVPSMPGSAAMLLIGRTNDHGLGMSSWWPAPDEDEEEEAEEEEEEEGEGQ